MSDAVVVALIGLTGTVISIILTARVNGKVKGIRHQVANDHSSNLRDDLDAKFKRVESRIRLVLAKQSHAADIQLEHTRDIRGMRKDIGDLRGADRELREEIENTRPGRAKGTDHEQHQ